MSQFLQSLADNAAFLLACLAVFAGLILIAWAAERFFLPSPPQALSGAYRELCGHLRCPGRRAHVLRNPLFFAPSFYEMDLSELPVLICTFYLGPVAGVVCEFLKSLYQAAAQGHLHRLCGRLRQLRRGLRHGAACLHPLPSHKSKKMALMGLAVGTLVMTVFGSAFNAYFLIPKFAELFHMPLDAIVCHGHRGERRHPQRWHTGALRRGTLNLLKGVVISALTLVLYKRVERLFFPSAPGSSAVLIVRAWLPGFMKWL